MDDKLSKIINDFLSLHPECLDPNQIAGACFNTSVLFIQACKKQGVKAELVELMDYRGKTFDNIHVMWVNSDFLCHFAVFIENKIYDFSYRQFDPDSPVPFIQTYSDLKKNWESVNVDFYMNSGGDAQSVSERME